MSRRRVLAVLVMLGTVPLAAGGGAAPARAEADPVLVAAGDVAQCGVDADEATAGIIDALPTATVVMLGDGAYPTGDSQMYGDCYEPSWGRFKGRTRPTPGNHDYAAGPDRKTAPEYYGYFGAAAADPAQGFYSYDLGAWHVVSLNSNCAVPGAGCTADSAQVRWLESDLSAHPASCVLAYWHHPRYFSVQKASTVAVPSSDLTMVTVWDVLQAHRADVVLNGHMHSYERFPPMDSHGNPTPAGLREFVVGTGGGPFDTFNPDKIDPLSEARVDNVAGVLRLDLHDGAYDWAFQTTSGTVGDAGHGDCANGAGATPPVATTGTTGPPAQPGSAGRSGYWMLGAGGAVYPFGGAGDEGQAAPPPGAEAVDLEPTASGRGYWVVDSAGRVGAFGDAARLSYSPPALSTDEVVTSLSATPAGDGYWIFTSRGRAFPYGRAVQYGDMTGVPLNGPVLDSVPTVTGRGYYMVGSDGGIFAFGDAAFRGSMGGRPLNAAVQSLVPDASGDGYWLVAADGGVFAFGDAGFRGSMGGQPLNRPVTGMVRFGDGYLMVAEDGGIFDFSTRPFFGSLGGNPPPRPIVSVAAYTSTP